MIQVISRAEIPSIHSVLLNEKEHNLGIVKDFTKNVSLFNFIPKDSNFSISWVHLDNGEKLDVHVHPTDSMIVVCQGNGFCLGDLEGRITDGDIVLIPQGHRHGFKGSEPQGFWALSIQFENRSLYGNSSEPLVNFVRVNSSSPEEKTEQIYKDEVLNHLLKNNERHLAEFAQHHIFSLLRQGYFNDKRNRARLLDCLQVWSNYFQKILFCRAAFCDNIKFADLAQHHLEEEFGHDTMLANSRKDLQIVWDSILESTSEWFLLKMLTLDNAEKVVLIHLVLEAAALVFYQEFGPLMKYSGDSTQHFEFHSEGKIDDAHINIGIAILKEMPNQDLERLIDIQKKGWEMFNTMFDRIADLCTNISNLYAANESSATGA